MRVHSVVMLVCCLPVGFASGAFAKGMEQLKDKNPENAEAKGDAEGDGEKDDKPQPQGAVSKAVSEKLSMGTSFGWVKASKSEGEWESGGMSDFSVGFRVLSIGPMPLSATYRYAPVAVTGKVDGHYYRGVWEGHYFGARVGFRISDKMTAYGGGELGYIIAHLTPVDGLVPEKKHEANGVDVSVGGGLDIGLVEKSAFALGPRANIGFGSFTIVQVGAAATYAF